MKKNHWITLIVGIAIVLGIYAVPGVAQQPAQQQAAPTPYIVAVVDVAQLIKQHPDFMTRQDALKAEVQQAEAFFQKRQTEIANKQKSLEAQFKPGTPDHQRLLDEITSDMAKFEADAKSQQRKFALANSQIMYDTYKDIKENIGRFAQQYNIAQVTDYREFEPNPNDPQTVAEDMDQRLVWYNPSLNITQRIIQQIYAAHKKTPPAPATATGTGVPTQR